MTLTPEVGPGLRAVDHVVVLMLENRSFDQMLGYLYAREGNVAPSGGAYEGLTGREQNPGPDGRPVPVRPAAPGRPYLYYLPGADPGEGFVNTNDQLFGNDAGLGPVTSDGFVTNYGQTLAWEATDPRWSVVPGTVADDIMTMFTPDQLPVLSALARGYAVCDHWYASVPTETIPNRAFTCAGTSQGHLDDKTRSFTCPSIFGALSDHGVSWSVYGYDEPPLTRQNFPDTLAAGSSHFGLFADFQAAAAAGRLASFVFLEPSWSSTGNSQHPNYDVGLGEQLILDVYHALRFGPGWASTLLVVTYDEHGGCYDHVPPPGGATPPDDSIGEMGFGFDRFGVRVPAVLVSPLVPAGTVFRAPAGGPPLDHTSILKTVELRWGLPPLTRRDAAAADFGGVVSLQQPRTDDPLAGVSAPVAAEPNLSARLPSHLQQVHADLVSRLPVPGDHSAMPVLSTADDYSRYIRSRTAAWEAGRAAAPGFVQG